MSHKKPPDDPAGTKLPGWMRSSDDIGQTCALMMRLKEDPKTNAINNPILSTKAFVIRATVQAAIGLEQMKKLSTTKEARGTRYILRTESISVRNALLKIEKLIDDTPVEVVFHPTLNVSCGVVYDPDTVNCTEELLLEELSSQGVVHVRRIRKRDGDNFKNLPLLVLSFSTTQVPDFIYIGLIRVKVRVYYPSPLLCFRCGTYGHSKKNCDPSKFEATCLRCSQQHGADDPAPCRRDPYCKQCKGTHVISSRDCPVYKNEEKIIKIKVDQGLSFGEARSLFNSNSNSYSAVTKQTTEDEKDRLITHLRKEVEVLRKLVENLRSKDNEPKIDESTLTKTNTRPEKNPKQICPIAEPNLNNSNHDKHIKSNGNKKSGKTSTTELKMDYDQLSNKRKSERNLMSPPNSPNSKKTPTKQNHAKSLSPPRSPSIFADFSDDSI